MSTGPASTEPFRYEGFQLVPAEGLLRCQYSLGRRQFEERVRFPGAGQWGTPQVAAAARLVFLLAGVSYYKTAAPPVIDLGQHAVTGTERDFLRMFYLDGLGEFSYRNGLDLSGLRIDGPGSAGTVPARGLEPLRGTSPRQRAVPAWGPEQAGRPLVPFGGGIDSIVTVEMIRQRAEPALFIVQPGPARRSRPSRRPPRSPGCRSCGRSARSTASCCARGNWGSGTAMFR